MEISWKMIIRRSIYTYLKHYQYFTSIATLISLPFSISTLISLELVPQSSRIIQTRLKSLFDASNLPPSSEFFAFFTLKLSQTISSSIITLPFAISFLLLAKASTIHFLNNHKLKKQSFSSTSTLISFLALYFPLLNTHIFNSFIIFSANATCLATLFVIFNFLDGFQITSPKWVLFLSSLWGFFYSIIIANTLLVCNLALVFSGMEGKGRLRSILKASMAIRGRTSTALSLAVPINLGLAAVEWLFHYRIILTPQQKPAGETQLWLVALEGLIIAYMYSVILVLDVIMVCVFYKSCTKGRVIESAHDSLMGIEEFWYGELEQLKGVEGCV